MIQLITPDFKKTHTMIWERVSGSVGAFKTALAKNDFYIFPLSESDQYFFKNVVLKPAEKLFRYETETSKICGMRPLIKINMENGLVYYLVETTEYGRVDFETRGIKPIWISIDSDQK